MGSGACGHDFAIVIPGGLGGKPPGVRQAPRVNVPYTFPTAKAAGVKRKWGTKVRTNAAVERRKARPSSKNPSGSVACLIEQASRVRLRRSAPSDLREGKKKPLVTERPTKSALSSRGQPPGERGEACSGEACPRT